MIVYFKRLIGVVSQICCVRRGLTETGIGFVPQNPIAQGPGALESGSSSKDYRRRARRRGFPAPETLNRKKKFIRGFGDRGRCR